MKEQDNKYELTVDMELNWGVCFSGGGDVIVDLIKSRKDAQRICNLLNSGGMVVNMEGGYDDT